MNDSTTETPELPSTRPYLLRAIWEWCMDSDCTPQILVNAGYPGVQVPSAFVQDGSIILNVHDRAVRNLNMGNDSVSFSARFGGVAHNILVPIDAVVAIYARENGQGLFFESPESLSADDESEQESNETADDDKVKPLRGKPDLKLV